MVGSIKLYGAVISAGKLRYCCASFIYLSQPPAPPIPPSISGRMLRNASSGYGYDGLSPGNTFPRYFPVGSVSRCGINPRLGYTCGGIWRSIWFKFGSALYFVASCNDLYNPVTSLPDIFNLVPKSTKSGRMPLNALVVCATCCSKLLIDLTSGILPAVVAPIAIGFKDSSMNLI